MHTFPHRPCRQNRPSKAAAASTTSKYYMLLQITAAAAGLSLTDQFF